MAGSRRRFLVLASLCAAGAFLTTCEPYAGGEAVAETGSALVSCSRWRNGALCDDGNPCTSGDRCSKGVCAGTAYACHDGNACTDDACDGRGGCTYAVNAAPCDDGNACTSGDVCAAGVCAGAPGVESCENATDDDCDGLVDASDPDCAASCSCPASTNPCVDAACDASGACVFVANANVCDDRRACTVDDVCSAGLCSGTVPPGTPAQEPDCTNGADDDCDGLVDFADLDCAPGCTPAPETACDDGGDNDCDGDPDSLDSDCPPPRCDWDFCPQGWACGAESTCYRHCFNGIWDGTEGDVDCGGDCAANCTAGQHCWTDPDCWSDVCENDVCL